MKEIKMVNYNNKLRKIRILSSKNIALKSLFFKI